MIKQFMLLTCVFGVFACYGAQQEGNPPMDLKNLLTFVRNDLIKFVTTSPPGSQFATLDRQIVITGPQELVELARKGDLGVVDQLVQLLKDPDRAWAAAVLLAALTGREGDIINAFAPNPEMWWDAVGRTAYDRWNQWLTESRGKLMWDTENQVFVEAR